MSAAPERPDVVVLGAGVIGLTAAWRLRERGLSVAIWSRDDTLATTSAVAGAIWYPFLANPRQRVLQWSKATYARLRELADVPGAGVHMQPVIEVFDGDEPDLWWRDAAPAIERLPAEDVPAGHRAAIRVDVPVCDVPVYLPWLREQVRAMGVPLVAREVQALDDAFAAADVVVNCTGLGARELCADDELVPVRGQLVVKQRVPLDHAWIDDTTPTPRYLVPRAGSIVCGGTAQHGDRSLAPRDDDSRDIVGALSGPFPQLAEAAVQRVTVGLRPYRSTVRLEAERRPGGRLLVHDYGHGGSGYTMAWGCADEVCALVTAAR